MGRVGSWVAMVTSHLQNLQHPIFFSLSLAILHTYFSSSPSPPTCQLPLLPSCPDNTQFPFPLSSHPSTLLPYAPDAIPTPPIPHLIPPIINLLPSSSITLTTLSFPLHLPKTDSFPSLSLALRISLPFSHFNSPPPHHPSTPTRPITLFQSGPNLTSLLTRYFYFFSFLF